jgi:hypothetical protein
MDESQWIEKAQSLEARIGTMKEQIDPLKEKIRAIKEMLCAREVSGGGIEIDFDALVDKLGLESCMELRKAIDERWRVSGEAGEKPRIRVAA